MSALIPPTFLFQLSIDCKRCDVPWSAKGFDLDEEFMVPSFRAELGDGPKFADVRMTWNESGMFFRVRTAGKKQSPWCRESRIEDSDGLSIWIDTRNTQNIHRASRFCHRFVFLPQGGGRLQDQPIAQLVEIHRAKEHPKPVSPDLFKVRSEKRIDGYVLHAMIPADAITGFHAEEHPRLGFCYAVTDRELGWQTYSLGPEFPFMSDPSLWGTIELVE